MAQIRVMFLLVLYVLTVTTFFSDAKSIRNTEIQISSSMSELFHLKESLPHVSERRKSKFFEIIFWSFHFWFLVFGHFWQWIYENMKMLCNLCLHFARQDGQDGKNPKKITLLKWTKCQKPKDENMGRTKHRRRLYKVCSTPSKREQESELWVFKSFLFVGWLKSL